MTWVRGFFIVVSFLAFVGLAVWGLFQLLLGAVLLGIAMILAIPIVWLIVGYLFPGPPRPRVAGCC